MAAALMADCSCADGGSDGRWQMADGDDAGGRVWPSAISAAAIRHRAKPKSPNPHPFLRRQIQLLSRLHIERAIPRVEVARGVGSVFGRRVAVGDDPAAQRLGAHLASPHLCEGNEEALIAAVALFGRTFFSSERCAVAVVGGGEAGD